MDCLNTGEGEEAADRWVALGEAAGDTDGARLSTIGSGTAAAAGAAALGSGAGKGVETTGLGAGAFTTGGGEAELPAAVFFHGPNWITAASAPTAQSPPTVAHNAR